MNNVYALVEHFYENNIDAEPILSQDFLEKYLRKHAWHGADDRALQRIWAVVRMLITYIEQMHLYSFASLTVYDYQEILYRLAQSETNFDLTEADVKECFDIMEDFYVCYHKEYEDGDELVYLQDARASVYEDGKFLMPPRRSQDEFYSSLNHQENVTEEDVDKLNALLDNLLHRVGVYFHGKQFLRDMNRALLLYSGPDYASIPAEDNLTPEQEMYWLSFWDYFLFDYHMIESDEVPLRYYFQHEKARLTISEQVQENREL